MRVAFSSLIHFVNTPLKDLQKTHNGAPNIVGLNKNPILTSHPKQYQILALLQLQFQMIDHL